MTPGSVYEQCIAIFYVCPTVALASVFAQPHFSPTHHLGFCHTKVLAAATCVLAPTSRSHETAIELCRPVAEQRAVWQHTYWSSSFALWATNCPKHRGAPCVFKKGSWFGRQGTLADSRSAM
ncbi:hypothetical protein M3J09_000371 [Ascochyta lentis]